MKLLIGSVSGEVLLLHVGKQVVFLFFFLLRELEEQAEDEAQRPEDQV